MNHRKVVYYHDMYSNDGFLVRYKLFSLRTLLIFLGNLTNMNKYMTTMVICYVVYGFWSFNVEFIFNSF